ncbi:MAG TPA: hypothetical protein VFR90_00740 [Methylibium sp.]|uniref:O-linked N-acetylglucosamine transferase, SPINDLY family protein n=1 Tax=Methylibium sp. TaxID=2067992 RepID=UPI002DB59820|nr:hypothetical protein [Methylibium sp.]HEU4457632.1 hypothetical protein [Methylibium sp.]
MPSHPSPRHSRLRASAAPPPASRHGFITARNEAYKAVLANDWAGAMQRFERLAGDAAFEAHDWVALSSARYKTGRIEAGHEAALRALAIEPGNAKAAHMATLTLVVQNRWAEALPIFERFASGPARQHYDFVVNHGVTLQQLGRHQDAVPVLLEAMVLEMADPAIHMRLGLTLKDLKLFEEAAESFRTAETLDPSRFAAQLMVVHMRQFACQWDGFEADSARIVESMARIERDEDQRGEGAVWALAAIEHPPLLFKSACAAITRKYAAHAAASPLAKRVPHALDGKPPSSKLRVGYVSGDFHNHATALLMVEALEHRDRERFEVTLYSHSPDDGSPIERRIRTACERYVDMRAMNERQMAERIAADGIDILVDLKGHTFGNRLAVFAWRPAPVQVAWLGFPGTCGADFIDYMIGDRFTTPIEHAAHYSEKLAQMPHSYQPNDSRRFRPAPTRRADWGLGEDAIVLGCFNQAFKIGPDNFAAWMNILRAVPNGVLWLLEDNAQASHNLRREAERAGIDARRLVFAPRVPVDVHLARLPCADFMLDNWPCNAHTTASDALWMGVPMVTKTGAIFASRVAAGLLEAVGLGELVSDDVAGYEATAIALARDPARLARLRAHLEQGRTSFPLFDGRRFARDLEALYERMAERQRAGLAPDHLPAATG